MVARLVSLLASMAMATSGCSASTAPMVTSASPASIASDQLATFAAYAALDRTCGVEAAASRVLFETYEACMRRGDIELCSVTEADWTDLESALIANDRSGNLEISRALVAEQCGGERRSPSVEEELWRVTDRCQTTGPFLRAMTRARWIQAQRWSSDRKAYEGGWCSGNIGLRYFSAHCGDFLLSERRANYRPPTRIYGFEQSICAAL